jgi:hypothetical protein
MDIYIDECSFNVGMRKKYAWGPKRIDRKLATPPRSENVTLLAAVCKCGLLGFCIYIGSVKSSDFAFFIGHLVETLEKKRYFNKYVLIYDNASIHYGGEYRESLMGKINVLNLAPYSPFLNPIEEVFAIWKKSVQNCQVNSIDQLVYAIATCGYQLKAAQFEPICQHSYSFYYKSYLLERVE